MEQTNQPVKRSNAGRWFWGIFISLIFIGMIFIAGSLLFFAKVVSTSDRYYQESEGGSGKGKVALVNLDYTIISSESI